MAISYKEFDHVTYLINNIALVDKNVTSKKEAWKYYIKSYEKYIFFDWKKYIEMYNDLKNINNHEHALQHFILYGKNEKRKYPEINLDNYNWELYFDTYNISGLKRNKRDVIKHYLIYGIHDNKVMIMK